MKNIYWLTFLLLSFFIQPLTGQEKDSLWTAATFSGLKFRSIGPAKMSGRIADIAINPNNENQWYIAVGSGGVWKTDNAGTTWTPIFDDQDCYSTGCITIDPQNDEHIWLGTGENVGGRHVSIGCGIYKSNDGGKSWQNMGLENSEHLSKIIVHPESPDIVWVASQGPLWSKGGERGIFKTVDGGEHWDRVLGDEEWVGATDLVIDPGNPDILYAATWQRHRTVAAYLGGGPGTGLYKSLDGGENWIPLQKGLPKSNMGKIGLAISPHDPNVLYAAVELDHRSGAVYRSENGGASWQKMSETVSGATGPHYYQELYACPHEFDRIYLMDVRTQVSDDGGKTFRRLNEKYKHSDNHAMAFKADEPDYIMMATDGGLYESYDLAQNWRYFANLPLTQFYKIALDDAEPFYNVYGGTQDNNTQFGPSQTDNVNGIQNCDWKVVLGGDGHQPATEPGNPDIAYGQSQQGHLRRIDQKTGEIVNIQPQAGEGEPHERFNWDAPILVSPHDPKKIYTGSYRLWTSDNRGDDWKALSGDLTRNQSRIELPIMGRQQSYDNAWDLYAMSTFNTITSIAESPVQKDLLYVGTDDGLIHVSENAGEDWTKIEVATLPDCPPRAYVNDIKADLFDANTVYIALDNHKAGDYRPLLYKSTNRGKSWKKTSEGLESPNFIWRIVQDHVEPNLFFLGTEFGLYFSRDGGQQWTQLKGGLPMISFRDLAIHRRDDDLVLASFGRSIYVFDDIEVFRKIEEDQLDKEAAFLTAGEAYWYHPRPDLSFRKGPGYQGASHYVAENPPYGASFTYYLKEGIQQPDDERKKREMKADTTGMDIEFPGWDVLDEEKSNPEDQVWIQIENNQGDIIRTVKGPAKKGFHRITWDMHYPSPYTVDDKSKGRRKGLLAAPGTYRATMYLDKDGTLTAIGTPLEFKLQPLYEPAIQRYSSEEVSSFWRSYESKVGRFSDLSYQMKRLDKNLDALMNGIKQSQGQMLELRRSHAQLALAVQALKKDFRGSPAKREIGEKTKPTLGSRIYSVSSSISRSTYGPTDTNLQMMQLIEDELNSLESKLDQYKNDMYNLADQVEQAGGPTVQLNTR